MEDLSREGKWVAFIDSKPFIQKNIVQIKKLPGMSKPKRSPKYNLEMFPNQHVWGPSVVSLGPKPPGFINKKRGII